MTTEALSANLSLQTASGSDSTGEPSQTVPAPRQTPAQAGPDRSLRGTRDQSQLPFQCRCGARWSGNSTCHCPSCHICVSGVTAFDRHRRNGQCLNPAGIGLTLLAGRAYECWGNTEDVTA